MMSYVVRLIARCMPGGLSDGQLAHGTLISLLLQGVGAGLVFFSEILLARMLGATGYGLFATVIAWMQVLLVVVLLGSNNLLVRFVPTYVATMNWASLRGAVLYSLLVSLGVGVIIIAISSFMMSISENTLSEELRRSFLIGMVILPVMAISIQRQAILRGLHHVAAALAPEYVVRPLCLILLSAAFYWIFGTPLYASQALIMYGLAAVFAFLIGRYFQKLSMPRDVAEARAILHAGEWFRIAMPLFLNAIMQLLIVRMDIILLGILAGHEEAGRYAVASRVSDVIVFMSTSTNVVAAPLIARHHARDDIYGMQRMLVLLTKGVLVLTLPLVVLIGIFGDPILGLFGNGYKVAYFSLLILACGQVVKALCGPVDFIMVMTGQHMKMLKILTLAATLNLALNLLLIPGYGMSGASVATACTTVFWNLYMRRVIGQCLGIDASILALFRGNR